jgi:hypothetical protein
MAAKPSRDVLERKTQKALLKEIASVAQELKENPWFRPLWQPLTGENAQCDYENANNPEWRASNERRWFQWRPRVTDVLNSCQRYVTDYGNEEHGRRFEANQLRQAVRASAPRWPDDGEPYFPPQADYQRKDCLADLESLIHLARSVTPPKRWKRPEKQLGFCANLKRARGSDKQEQAVEEISQLRRECDPRQDRDVTQSEYSLWESGARRPKGANLKACMSYIENKLKMSSGQ